MTGGELAAFVFYAVVVASGVAAVSEVIGELQRAAGATERLLELMNVTPSIQSPKPAALIQNENANHHIEFDKVSFCYPSRPNIFALKDISFTINGKSGLCTGIYRKAATAVSEFFR